MNNDIDNFKYSNKNIKEKCKELAEILNLADPVPENVLYGALYDDGYANALVKSKEDEDSLTMLLENPPDTANHNTAKLLKGFGMSIARWAMNGFNTIDSHIIEERRRACNACPHKGNAKDSKNVVYKLVSKGPICKLCGCKLESKIKMIDESCPDNRWYK